MNLLLAENKKKPNMSLLTASVQPNMRLTKAFHCKNASSDCPICQNFISYKDLIILISMHRHQLTSAYQECDVGKLQLSNKQVFGTPIIFHQNAFQ